MIKSQQALTDRIIGWREEAKNIKTDLAKIQTAITGAETDLLESLAKRKETFIQSGTHKFERKEKIGIQVLDQDKLMVALKGNRATSHLVKETCNFMSLSKFIREEKVPASIKKQVTTTTSYSLSVTKRKDVEDV